MTVLVVGGGGREHAICHALSRSPRVTRLLCAPGNGGIASVAECFPVKATDLDGMVALAEAEKVDYVMVAPDDPLALGMVDRFEAVGIPAFGPRKNAAILESSKAFSKSLMAKYGIPTARYETFTDLDKARAYIREQGAPIVVKADGLALGKGVVVAQSVDEALEAAQEMLEGGKFGDSGRQIVVEEFMAGREVTVLCFTDGKTVVPMLPSRDHKRAHDGDRGPNTGGMGAICPVLDYTPALAGRCMQEIFLPTINAMRAEGRPFKGVLYFGLMLTNDGPKVVEYNARFGDPEAQPILSLLETDLMEIFLAISDERLDTLTIRWKDASACCVVLASGGYPVKYESGYPIHGLDTVPKHVTVYHAGTKRCEDGTIVTAGGRVLGVTAVADSLDGAIDLAYRAARDISFTNMHYRTDIGRT